MSDPPEMDELARRFLDLWEQNLTAAAGDPEMAKAMGQFFGRFNPMTQPAGAQEDDEDTIDIGAMLASIDRRLAAIEKRLDRIEAAGKASKAKPRPAKGR